MPEITTLSKGSDVKTVEVPVIVPEIRVLEVERPIVTKEVQIVEVEKPVIIKVTKIIQLNNLIFFKFFIPPKKTFFIKNKYKLLF